MFEKFQLLAHLGALRKFLLLGQGDIIRCTLYPKVPCTLYPVPCTLYPVPCTLYPVPCTLYPVP